MADESSDVAVIGAGPAGLCQAVELAGAGLQVSVIDRLSKAQLAEPADDGREIALTHASRKHLERCGIWQHLDPQACAPIREVRLYNGHESRGLILADTPRDAQQPLGWLVANRAIRRAAFLAASACASIEWLDGRQVSGLRRDTRTLNVTFDAASECPARLVVGADGRFSMSRRLMGVPAQLHDSGQRLLVGRVSHERPHGQVTWSWFDYGQALSLLPLQGSNASLVMTLDPADAERLLALGAEAFSAEITRRYRHCLGDMRRSGEFHAYPLVESRAERLTAPRFALIGDAALGLHPVTAHGFNVGLASVRRLAEEVRKARTSGRDIGADTLLAAYERRHRRATQPLWLASRSLTALYGDTQPLARLARHGLLGAARHAKPLRWLLGGYLRDGFGQR
ncbi:5-demethoxyubiquinol-8 5-hydroxylase UbiM [Modicisalibacter radicis]|uniref:5-demethoxyubiquinol-8 5-hydroxylase UbiM n=1 Tax=Halomonas sp. EAR18 TaxID=2518972 RepID=UPI00109C8499|nr:5-demethoxyubiquinol-8 5-hydroxylase UbiM [Halomonas sp. EAR18]